MATETRAPWAEPVLLTAEDLLALPDDAYRYELVEGRLVRMPPTGFEHGSTLSRLLTAMGAYVEAHKLGTVVAGEPGFILSRPGEPDTVLAPDIAFVSAARVPARDSSDWSRFPRLAPDLVVEIVSPSQRPADMAAKARFWLGAGVKLVWVVWPQERQVDIWQAGSESPAMSAIAGEQLEGGDVLPGFRYPVARLFA